MFGSSPRVWGTLFPTTVETNNIGFIPTCVGNTVRSGGDSLLDCGSSPRVWGTLISRLLCESKSRFIPTCVGNTSHHRNTPTARAVHPHVCGEHYGPLDRAVSGNGSSPRVWGTRPHVATGVSVIRFIPTCVGNTFCCLVKSFINAVHPHVCGEHLSLQEPCL